MITEDYVSFEIAKLLKEKGFDEACHAFYDSGHRHILKFVQNSLWNNAGVVANNGICVAPTLQMTMKWLREAYGICIELLFHPNKEDWGWYFQILVIDNIKKCFCGYGPYKTYSSYEEACEAVIKYCLEKLI